MDKKYEEKKQCVDFGLIGKNISYSFSKKYFTEKFSHLKLTQYEYHNFDIHTIKILPTLLNQYPNLKGLSVTIPYKEQIFPFLDEISEEATEIGAVNTVKICNKKLIGYNTDIYGFENSLKPLLQKHHQKALILGTGGASKAVKYVLKKLSIPFISVSRTPKEMDEISYKSLNEEIIKEYQIIVNCSPIGTFPTINEAPNIPYQFITKKHLLYDLIYNPDETLFLKNGKAKGATIKNGLEMLQLQAEKAWEIWSKP